MKLDYTDHASERLEERGIPRKEIEEALLNGRKEDAGGDLRKSTERNQKGTLIVIYRVKSSEEVVIITAYWE